MKCREIENRVCEKRTLFFYKINYVFQVNEYTNKEKMVNWT